MNSRILRQLVLILVSVCALPLAAQENRTALVIGCDYEGTGLHLPSPLQDAKAIATKLESLGFTVIISSNPDLEAFDKAANAFGDSLKTRKGVGLFYFSGHGAQVDEKNYLIPHKAKLSFREDLRTRAYAAQDVVTRMEAAGCRLNLLFLDACRTNELPSSTTKSLGKGLADMDAAAGMLISFASARNTEALDSGKGSVYTNALLTHIATPGLSVLDMLTQVNAAVKKETSGRQVPFMESGLDGTFAFAPGGPGAKPPPPLPAPPTGPATATRERPWTNSLGMEFIPVPGRPGLLMCRTETRVSDFRAFATDSGYRQSGGINVMKVKGTKKEGYSTAWEVDAAASWEKPGFAQSADHPVVGVSWEEARVFATWLSKKEKLTFRLPTDAEWSAAVGVGKYPWGTAWPPPKGAGNYFGKEASASLPTANWKTAYDFDDGAARTASVASFTENKNGFFDLGGNVWEWCEDIYQPAMNSAEVRKEIPALDKEKASDGTPFRVVRGGSWVIYVPSYLLSSYRNYEHPSVRNDINGFRLVLVSGGGG